MTQSSKITILVLLGVVLTIGLLILNMLVYTYPLVFLRYDFLIALLPFVPGAILTTPLLTVAWLIAMEEGEKYE